MVAWFAQNPIIENGELVSANNQRLSGIDRNSLSLFTRKVGCEIGR
jgi:hypothetical protein